MATAGYSGTPLAKKLGIKEGYKVLLSKQPNHYFELFDTLPDIELLTSIKPANANFVHLFYTSFSDFMKESLKYKKALHKDGMLWISWPKGSSKIATDIKRDNIREFLLKNGLVDVKVCAIDEDWSGLKFVYRLEDRKAMV